MAVLGLELASYRRVWMKVLTRDGWRCQICGSSSNLHVHHIMRRSSLVNDEEENLITLCASCHCAAHGQLREGHYPKKILRALQAASTSIS
jgi:5-methylcytosine-specific restriction endonuclease McrA